MADESVMVVVAHPDDAEFMAGGSVALWTREGREVSFVIVTNGNKGSEDPEMTSERLVTIREDEQRHAADALGVVSVTFLGYEDGMLEATLDVRRDIVRAIRQQRPHIVVTFDPTVRFLSETYPNHPDHRATGDATVDAVFPAARDRLTFPELAAVGLAPHKVRELWLGGASEANHWVDIEPVIEQKLAALRIHESQLANLPLDEFVPQMAKDSAAGSPYKLAESFRRVVLD